MSILLHTEWSSLSPFSLQARHCRPKSLRFAIVHHANACGVQQHVVLLSQSRVAGGAFVLPAMTRFHPNCDNRGGFQAYNTRVKEIYLM